MRKPLQRACTLAGAFSFATTKAMSASDASAARKERMAFSGTEAAKQRSDAWDLFPRGCKSHELGRCVSSAESANGFERHGSCKAAE